MFVTAVIEAVRVLAAGPPTLSLSSDGPAGGPGAGLLGDNVPSFPSRADPLIGSALQYVLKISKNLNFQL